MKNKTLGWWTIGLCVAYFVFYMGDPEATLMIGLSSSGFIIGAIWGSIRLINMKETEAEVK